ncbi:MAG: transporter related protein [Solirubrobacterales bacterium]|nr:transporter related protein [Solirubrobacterales bacterium]
MLLQTRGVTQRFGGLVAVDDVDFTVEARSVVSLIGPNGAGKSTFFNTVAGFLTPAAGSITFDGEEIAGLPQHKIVKAGIARTFQNIRLFGQMTALENVMVGTYCRTHSGIVRSVLRLPARREEQWVLRRGRELLDLCEVPGGAAERLASHLSYGHQRRLEIARALATEPRLLMLDEPTAGMNPRETADFIEFLRKLRDELELAVVLIEHDMNLVMTVSERITVLDRGRKLAEGSPAEIRSDERVIEAYLGRRHNDA